METSQFGIILVCLFTWCTIKLFKETLWPYGIHIYCFRVYTDDYENQLHIYAETWHGFGTGQSLQANAKACAKYPQKLVILRAMVVNICSSSPVSYFYTIVRASRQQHATQQ